MQQCVGVDLGYGFVKVTDGQDGYAFPSVVGDGGGGDPLLRTRATAPGRTDDLRLTLDGQSYFVGKLAIRQSRLAFRCLSATRGEGNDLKVLFLAGLSLFCHQPTNSFAVVTGLPPGRMHRTEELLQQLSGEHHVVLHRGQEPQAVTIRVDRFAAVPQPLGSFWLQALDARGQIVEDGGALAGHTGVIDIGYRTTDLAVLDAGEYVPEQSRTIGVGLGTAYEDIAARVHVAHGLELPTYTLDDAIVRGEISVAGRRADIVPLRDAVFSQLATKILVELNSAWQLAEFDTLLVTGGGAEALSRYLLPHLPQAQVLSDPVTANCRGYVAWARRMWNAPAAPWTENHTAIA